MMSFFERSEWLDYEVLRPLSHICGNWELSWDHGDECYKPESNSFAATLNALIAELGQVSPPEKYHDNEDRLADYVIQQLKWPIQKRGNRWEGEQYDVILQQGGFSDGDQRDLVLAAAGRIRAAMERGQNHYDEMEDSHRKMLGAVLCVILYHRTPSAE